MVEPRKFKPRKPSLDTGIRTPGMARKPHPERTHRDAAAEVKRRLEQERLAGDQDDPVAKAEELNALDRDTILPETDDVDGPENT